MSNYLRREADSFFFRRRVPAHLQARLSQTEIYRSLGTTVRRTAKARAAHLFIATEKLFRMIDEDDEYIVTEEDIRAAVRLWLDTSAWKQRLKIVDGMTPGGLRMHHDTLPEALLAMSADEGVTPSYNLALEAHAALEHADFPDIRSGETLWKTAAALKRQLREYVDARMQAVFAPATVAIVAQSGAAPVTPQTPANLSKLSSFIKEWQQDIVTGYNFQKALGDETTDQYLQTVQMFIGLMGDLPVGHISFEKAAEFRELVLQMPASHGKGSIRSPKKELARARAAKTTELLSMTTAKRHFSGMRSIWKWLVYKKHIPASHQPFSGHSFPGTKTTKSSRDDWSSEDMQRLFTSSEYSNAPDASALHWLPLISLHSGMRLEEICRLRPSVDIVTKNGTPCFDIKPHLENEGWAPWDPKTESGVRIIPIHSWLLNHEFMELVKRQRAAGADYLFSPELVLHEKKLSSGFSREFSKLKIDLCVGEKTVFHSFRHTFRTVLESTDHKESHIDAVMGHEPGSGSQGRSYSKRVTIQKLKEVVESFASPLDLDFLGKAGVASAPLPAPKIKFKKRKLIPPVFNENGKVVRQRKR